MALLDGKKWLRQRKYFAQDPAACLGGSQEQDQGSRLPAQRVFLFAWGALAHPRTLGHPPTAGSCPPDLAEALQSCLDSAGSVVNTGEGFSYLRVTSHSPSCQQPKEPSTCRLQISAKLESKCVSLHWSPNRRRELQRTV